MSTSTAFQSNVDGAGYLGTVGEENLRVSCAAGNLSGSNFCWSNVGFLFTSNFVRKHRLCCKSTELRFFSDQFPPKNVRRDPIWMTRFPASWEGGVCIPRFCSLRSLSLLVNSCAKLQRKEVEKLEVSGFLWENWIWESPWLFQLFFWGFSRLMNC